MIPDGSDARLVKDIAPGLPSSSPSGFVALGTQLFFTASTGEHGRELWTSDGTEAGTFEAADVLPGPGGSQPQFLTAHDGRLFFSADDGMTGQELWSFDGASAALVADIEPGAEGSLPTSLLEIPNGEGGTVLLFSARTSTSGAEPWTSRGTTASTSQLADLNPGSASSGPALFVVVGQRVFFSAAVGVGRDLWSYHTVTGALQEHDTGATEGAFPFELTGFDGRVFYAAIHQDTGSDLWFFDGTSAAPTPLDIVPGPGDSQPLHLTVAGNVLFFEAQTSGEGKELWYVRDLASGGGAFLARDVNPGTANGRAFAITPAAAGAVFFSSDDGTRGMELWRMTSSSPAGAALVSRTSFRGPARGRPGRPSPTTALSASIMCPSSTCWLSRERRRRYTELAYAVRAPRDRRPPQAPRRTPHGCRFSLCEIERCRRCGGRLRTIASIESHAVIERARLP